MGKFSKPYSAPGWETYVPHLQLSDEDESSPSSQPRMKKDLSVEFARETKLPGQSPLNTPTDSDTELDGEDDTKMYNDFDIQGVSKEELAFWSQLAPPDQKLTDPEILPQKLQSKSKKAPSAYVSSVCYYNVLIFSKASTSTVKPSSLIAKSVNHFIRRHPFFAQQSLSAYTTSERRKFERDVYDFARAQGLSKVQAKIQTVKAREMCGEEEYDSENSALGDEVNDNKDIIRGLSAPSAVKSTSSEVWPPIETKEVIEVPSEEEEQATITIATKGVPSDAKENEVNAQTPHVETEAGKSSKSAETKLKSSQTNNSEVPDVRTKVDKRIGEAITEVQHSSAAQPSSVAAGKSKAGLEDESNKRKAERKEKKRAKRKVEMNGVTAQQTLGADTKHGPNQGSPDEIIPPPTKGPNDPNTEVEAHENYLKSNERNSPEPEKPTDKSTKEQEQAAKRSAAFDAELRAARDYANEHAIDLYSQGKYKGASKQFREEMKTMAADRQAREDREASAKDGAASKKRKKRKSAASEDVLEGRSTNKKRKSNGDAAAKDPSHSKSLGFRSPMIQ